MSEKQNREVNPIERHILDAIKDIRYGAVEVLIHDARIVQVEKTEKIRFDPRT
jgi:hypothetical protein